MRALEELARIRNEISGLLTRWAEARLRSFRGHEIDLVSPFRLHGAAVHDEAPRILDEALARSGSDAEKEGLCRLRRLVILARVRGAALRLEEEITRREIAQRVEGPEGPALLRAALRAVALERQRGRRALLQEACGRAFEEQEGMRADRVALLREAAGREGLPLALEVGEAREALRATEDAFRELLAWTLGRFVEEGLQPLPRGDLREHDLAWLFAAPFVGGIFPGAGLLLAAHGLVEPMGFAAARRLRLDLERRPAARLGACAEATEREVVVSLSPLGTPADWRDLFGALGWGLHLASIPPAAPVEDRRGGDGAPGHAFSALFRGIPGAPIYLRRLLQAPKRAAAEAARFFAFLELLELRIDCARALWEAELWGHGPSRQAARHFGEIFAEATGAQWDERLYLLDADPELPAAAALRGQALAGALEPALLERCDEDWWRNPRTGPLLEGIWARGGAVDAAETARLLGADAPSLVARAKRLVARLG